MKNKIVKILSTGICCIMISVLISAYLLQNDKMGLSSITTHKNIISAFIDPPFH